ncbi:MAG: hypothetical protein IJ088_04955 [Clostridia bacterium]|nr:hypothetical protein [Clostridia bacterium]
MFDWLKIVFGRGKTSGKLAGNAVSDAAGKPLPDRPAEAKAERALPTNPCRECGKPSPYDPSWRHQPNFCPECREKYRQEQRKKTGAMTGKPAASSGTEPGTEGKKKEYRKMIKRTCKSCGRPFSFPSTIQHWPRYCRECRKNYRGEQA